jgi:hypothetical protein
LSSACLMYERGRISLKSPNLCYDVDDSTKKIVDKPRKRKLVKIKFGKRPKPVLFKLFLYVAVAAIILIVFYLFSLANFTPSK